MRFFALLALIATATAISIEKSAGGMDSTFVYNPLPAPPTTEWLYNVMSK